MLTQSRLKELLSYNSRTGDFTWRVGGSNRVSIGDSAGYVGAEGYRSIKIDKRHYRAHRLAWLYVTGDWPVDQIDHINGVRNDNRFENLREANDSQNRQNLVARKDNKSMMIGVCLDNRSHKWRAQIQVGGVKVRLGSFASPEQAHAAYCAAKAKLHTYNPVVRA